MKSPTHALIAVSVALLTSQAECSTYVAFSLGEAQKSVQNNQAGKVVRNLGGITRPIGLVVDESVGDIILVGESDPKLQPLNLDAWPVVLRAMDSGMPPLVSIDRNSETNRTQQQDVRFEGGIQNTSVGRDLLAADVVLKKLGLGLLSAKGMPLQSYADARAGEWLSNPGTASVLSIMWFFPSERSVVTSQADSGVALIDQFEVGVYARLLSRGAGGVPTGPSDPLADKFARDVTLVIPELAAQFPSIERVEPIFRLSGLAKAVVAWKVAGKQLPRLDYWLKDYPVARVETPAQHPLLISHPRTRDSDHVKFSVDGGIRADLLLRDWQDGSDSALKALVILSRPGPGNVFWEVPLDISPDKKLVATLVSSPFAKTIKHPIWAGEGTSFCTKIEGINSPPIPKPLTLGTSSKGIQMTSHRVPDLGLVSNPKDFKEMAVNTASPTLKQDLSHAVRLSPRDKMAADFPKAVIYGSGQAVAQALLENRDIGRVLRQGSDPSKFETASFKQQLAAGVAGAVAGIHVSSFPIERPDRDPTFPTEAAKLPPPPRSYDAALPESKRPERYPKLPDPPPPGGGQRPDGGLARQMTDAIQSSINPHQLSPGVGGVMLRGEARAEDADSELASGDFSLAFGESGVIGITGLRRFVTALWATYFTETGPGISIDPIGEDLTGPHAVRYIGNVINSDLGRVMREADYLMKSWSVGTSRPDVPGWKSPEGIAREQGVMHLSQSRFWFVPENMVFRKTDNGLSFEDGRMTLKTEYLLGEEEQAENERGKKKKPVATASPENEKWAAMFTKRYVELSAKHPVLSELCEYAQYVSLAKYLKQRKVPMLWFLLANRELVLTEDSPGTVESFAKKSKAFDGVEVRGGVDFKPAGGFVWDEKLCDAVAQAGDGKPDRSAAVNPQIPTVIEDKAEPPPEVPAQRVVIGESGEGEGFATDLGIREGMDPVLELARFRRNDLPLVQTFGRDWHLMIPFTLRPGSKKVIEFEGVGIPETMVLRNLVSGREEEMSFDKERYDTAGYVPADASSSVNIGLFLLTDGSLRLADKLGCQYEFDPSGRLTSMDLGGDFHLDFRYGTKELHWRNYNLLPFRLTPTGSETVRFGNLVLPRQLTLFDVATGREDRFTFTDRGPDDNIGYLPETADPGAWRFISLLTDGSLVLTHRAGGTVEFDPRGAFRRQVLNIVESVASKSHEVKFQYDMLWDQYRIQSAEVTSQKTGTASYRLTYTYDDQGSIQECRVVAMQRPKAPDPGLPNK